MISTISTTWFCNTSFKLQKTLHITTWSWTTKFSLQSNSTIRISEGKILRFLCLFHVCFKSWYKTVMGKVDFHKAKSFPITYTEWVWSLASLKKQVHKYLNYNQKLLRNILLHKIKFHLFFSPDSFWSSSSDLLKIKNATYNVHGSISPTAEIPKFSNTPFPQQASPMLLPLSLIWLVHGISLSEREVSGGTGSFSLLNSKYIFLVSNKYTVTFPAG